MVSALPWMTEDPISMKMDVFGKYNFLIFDKKPVCGKHAGFFYGGRLAIHEHSHIVCNFIFIKDNSIYTD